MAWRHLLSQKSQAGLSFMTTFSIVGVALGVAALMTVLSVMGGFESDMVAKMLRGQPHIEILSPEFAAGISLKQYPVEAVRALVPEAVGAEPFTQSDVVLKNGRHLGGAILIGIDPARQSHLWAFDGTMTAGEIKALDLSATKSRPTSRPGIILGGQLAAQLNVDLGDEISVISPAVRADSALGGGTLSRVFEVVGIFQSQLFAYDAQWAVVTLVEGRKFLQDYEPTLDELEFVSGIALNLRNPQTVDQAVEALKEEYPGVKAVTWKETNKSLLFALKLEKFAMGAVLLLVVVVAAFSISGTLMMTVYHRRHQICLLRALGMSEAAIRRLFLTHGVLIGGLGTLIGTILGLALCSIIQWTWGRIPLGVLHLRAIKIRYLPGDYFVIAALALLISLVAAVYPAAIAARQSPSTGLRYD